MFSFFFECVTNGSYRVLARLYGSLGQIRARFGATGDRELVTGLRKFLLDLSSGQFQANSWDLGAGADYTELELRNLLLSVSIAAGNSEVIDEARRRFKAHVSGEKTLDPNIRTAVLRCCVKWGGKEEYEQVKQLYLAAGPSIEIKESCLAAMSTVQDESLAVDFLEFLLSPAVSAQDVHHGAGSLGVGNKAISEVLWKFIRDHWEERIYPTYKDNMVLLDRFVRVTLNRFVSAEKANEIRTFFKGRDNNNAGYDRAVAVSLDRIEGAAKYVDREMEPVRAWLKEKKYV